MPLGYSCIIINYLHGDGTSGGEDYAYGCQVEMGHLFCLRYVYVYR